MNPILMAILAVAVIGIICALVLVVASTVMAVKEDPKMGLIRECLPGANCGACGYAGCDGYAKALADGSETKTNLCIPGADACAHAVSDILGVAAEDVVEMVAVVRCSGDCDKTKDKMDYQGVKTCKAVKQFYGGLGSCTFGCIGFGDCEAVCPVQAISIERSLAKVNDVTCIGCGVCARTCPTGVIATIPRTGKVLVTCSSNAKGAVVRKACTAGCIGCTKCQQVCPHDAIHVVNNLAEVDQSKCTGCGTCVESCPVKCIQVVDHFTQWQAVTKAAR